MRLFSGVRNRVLVIGLAALCLAGVLVGPHLGTFLYWYRDRSEFPKEADLPPAGPGFRLPVTSPTSGPYRLADMFPGVSLDAPTEFVFGPGGSIFLLERAGRVWLLPAAGGERKLIVDFSAEVGTINDEEGAVGLVLHPSFGSGGPFARRLFVYFTAHEGGKRFDRLVRYELGEDLASPTGSLRLIDQFDEHGDHNGGTLRFGADGYLYVSIGDEGNCNCGNHQRIDKDLFGGILRIDVDGDDQAAVHQIRRQPASGKTQGYWIPNDNPFVGTPDAIEEFWSIGLRNPFRIAFDPTTGRLFGGDVGHGSVESVFEATKGSNHRWSLFEGNKEHRFVDQPTVPTLHGVMTPPVHAYPHDNMNLAVIGGLVYRGKKFPELVGKYIYGDNVSGRVWALDLESKDNRQLLTLTDRADHGLVAFVADPEGELCIVTMGAKGSSGSHIFRLVSGQESSDRGVPTLLSETGLFSDMQKLSVEGGISYDVALPMWMGREGVESQRWVVRLARHSSPVFRPKGDWDLKGGLAFIKHLKVGGRNVETQVLIMSDATSGYGLSYEWNEAGTDATLVTEGHDRDLAGAPWHFGATEECSMCHSQASGIALGFSSRQLNVGDQLLRLRREGLFKSRRQVTWRVWGPKQPKKAFDELLRIERALEQKPLVQESLLPESERLSAPKSSAPLAERVRSYLDVNCAPCHRPGGAGGISYDARYEVDMDAKGLRRDAHRPIGAATRLAVPGEPKKSLLFVRMNSSEVGVHMPPVGPPVPDPAGTQLMIQWLRSLQ